MNCINCEGIYFATISGSALFGISDLYADYTYRVCMTCGLKVGKLL